MDFSIEKKRLRAEEHYSSDDLDIAHRFAKRAHEECRDLLRAVVLFGSTARKKQGAHDIDILLIIDDVSLHLTPELIQTYRVITAKIIKDISQRIHLTTLKFSAFWEYVRTGDPIAVNILRDGFPLLDTGFFDPMQLLLHQGRIRPSPESILTHQTRAEQTLDRSKTHLLEATMDLYWSVVDAAHAALMRAGHVPASPEHVADMLQDKLVRQKLMSGTAPQTMRKFYTLAKDIEHRKKKEITGVTFDKLYKEAQEFFTLMKRFIEEQDKN